MRLALALLLLSRALLAGPGEHMVSHAKKLETRDATFTIVYLAPNQYTRTPGYRPTEVGTLLEKTADRFAREAGDFVVEDFRHFYRNDPQALEYIEHTLAPSLKDGKILNGRVGMVMIYRQGRGDASGAQLVGVMQSTWPTKDSPHLPLQDGSGAMLSQSTSEGTQIEIEETREVGHLAVRPGVPEDVAAMLARYASEYGVMGPRTEEHWTEAGRRHVVAKAKRFVLRCVPRLVSYYRERGRFRVDKKRSGPKGVVMSLPAEKWSPEHAAAHPAPGKIPLATVMSGATEQVFTPFHFIRTLDYLHRTGAFPSAEELAGTIARGAFRAVSEQEVCEDLMKRLKPRPLRLSPGHRGEIDP